MNVPVSPSTAVYIFPDTYHILYIQACSSHMGSPTSIFLTSLSSASSVPPSGLCTCTPQLVVHSESLGPSPSRHYISDTFFSNFLLGILSRLSLRLLLDRHCVQPALRPLSGLSGWTELRPARRPRASRSIRPAAFSRPHLARSVSTLVVYVRPA